MKTFNTLFSFIILLFLSNCGSKDCDISCQNGGVALTSDSNCECQCPVFYTGENCETAINIKVNGLYSGTSTCNGSSLGDSHLLTASTTSPSEFNISEIGDAAFIDATNFSLLDNDGSGTVDNGALTLNYLSYVQGSQLSTCTFTGSK